MGTTTFSSLKQSRESSLDKLAKEMAKMQKGRSVDERFWRCETDKAGNGTAVVRFLPAPASEEVPFVRLWHHAFKGPGGAWYFENSLTTIDKQDPVSELNSKMWNEGDKGKAIARAQKRKLKYITNVYIVKDAAKPENEGKVFLFSFGKKIFDKLNEKMEPAFADDPKLNPFDLWNGANFKLRICKVAGFTNYDNSSFEPAAPLHKDDAKMETVWQQTYPLQPFVAVDQFKSYKELKDKLEKVLAIPTGDSPVETAEPATADAPVLPSADGNGSAGSKKNLEFFAALANEEDGPDA